MLLKNTEIISMTFRQGRKLVSRIIQAKELELMMLMFYDECGHWLSEIIPFLAPIVKDIIIMSREMRS